MEGSQRDHLDPIVALRDMITKGRIKIQGSHSGVFSASFVPKQVVDAYFHDRDNYRTKKLLVAVYGDNPPVSARDVATHCRRVCCILALIGKLAFIATFVNNRELWDEQLPFDSSNFPVDSKDEAFFDRFDEHQSQFCARVISSATRVIYDRRYPLPFSGLEPVGRGYTATVYKATIQKEYDGLQSQQTSPHVYAVKSYHKRDGHIDFDRELEAFKRIVDAGLLSTRGIVKFYTGFHYGGTFNIVLEYAAGQTLEHAFSGAQPVVIMPPTGGHDIIAFWNSLLEVFYGLSWIHDRSRRLQIHWKEKVEELGWHQDLKPENILLVADTGPNAYKGFIFKIADFGLSRFRTDTANMSEDEPSTPYRWGTSTYGAPEYYSQWESMEGLSIDFKRPGDVWSLGCILSEAAVWTVKNPEGLEQYRKARTSALERKEGFRLEDCFHDGTEVLPVVKEQHSDLKNSARKDDYMTGRVLDSMVSDMLLNTPTSRPNASQLVARAEEHVKEARKELCKRSPASLPDPLSTGSPSRHIPRISLDTPRKHAILPTESPFTGEPQPIVSTPSIMQRNSGAFEPDGLGIRSLVRQQTELQSPTRQGRRSNKPSSRFTMPSGSFTGDPPLPLEISADATLAYRPADPPISRNGAELSWALNSPPTEVPQPLTLTGRPSSLLTSSRSPLQYCSVKEAWDWCKTRRDFKNHKKFPYKDVLSDLSNRDFVFLIDDSTSMIKHHWDEVQTITTILVTLAKINDPDGSDLQFLSSSEKFKIKYAKDAEDKLAERRQNHEPTITTSLDRHLNDQISEYLEQRGTGVSSRNPFRSRKQPRPRIVYILTNGVLSHGEATQGQEGLTTLYRAAHELSSGRGQFGVQFISFGSDFDGLARLRDLDLFGQARGFNKDFVDTEPSDGNFLKMLAGSLNKKYDDDGEDPPATPQHSGWSPDQPA